MSVDIDEWLGFERDPGFSEYTHLNHIEPGEGDDFALVSPVEEHMLNPYGIVHGGVYFTLCDNAAGVLTSRLGRYSVTMQGEINLYRAAKLGDTLRARPSLRKLGHTVSVVLVEITDQEGRRLADGTFTMYRSEHT